MPNRLKILEVFEEGARLARDWRNLTYALLAAFILIATYVGYMFFS